MSGYAYTNKYNVSLALAAFLIYDDYDYDDRSNAISATTLMKPLRQLVLVQQNKQLLKNVDITELAAASMGSAIHDRCERAWTSKDNIAKALKILGASDEAIDTVKINPSTVEHNQIPVFVEQRTEKEIIGFIVTGKFDLNLDGNANDYKSTSVWGYIYDSNANNHTLQGSIYKWLNEGKITQITSDYINIHYIFTDWSSIKAKQDSRGYPQQRVMTRQYPLWATTETENWIMNKIESYVKLADAPQHELPFCTDEELWATKTVHKYYKNPNSMKRSTKNFQEHEYQEAIDRKTSDGNVGIVVTVPGEVKRCHYCAVIDICDQAKNMIAEGRLIL